MSIDLGKLELDKLQIIHYPDPRLRVQCEPITTFDEHLKALADHMLEIMKAGNGVGLAAPQLGLPVRMFVMNHTGEDKDAQVFVNPEIHDPRGNAEREEGCLCVPGVYVQVRRATHCRIVAQDLNGKSVELEGENMLCRVWQHETDHLNGILILDRMGPSDRIATRKQLRELQEAYKAKRPARKPKPAATSAPHEGPVL